MKLELKGRKETYNAIGDYNPRTKCIVVKKGSKVSETLSESQRFGGLNSVKKLRENYVENNVVTKDVSFTSPSTAANFVTGFSTNGLISWKDENGRKLKDLLNKC